MHITTHPPCGSAPGCMQLCTLALFMVLCICDNHVNIFCCNSQDFKLKSGQFDISLIPDIYDCIKYDVQHNRLVQELKPLLDDVYSLECTLQCTITLFKGLESEKFTGKCVHTWHGRDLSVADMTMLTDDHVSIVLCVNVTESDGTDYIFTL